MKQSTIWVGLDVHKESVTAAVLEDRSTRAEVVRLPGELHKIRRFFRRLASRGHVRACYEASGAGSVISVAAAGSSAASPVSLATGVSG